jgi:hypothetical protein
MRALVMRALANIVVVQRFSLAGIEEQALGALLIGN